MRLHRFFVKTDIELTHDFWLHDIAIINQWRKVLRYQAGQEVVLFDGIEHDRLYRIEALKDTEAHLILVTEFERKLPKKNVYLLWSLLKKDKNDWVLQKCTELGVSHFVPIMTERTEKLGFDVERAEKILIEAAEQCGRSDIPNIREPILLEAAIHELKDKIQLFVCEQGSDTPDLASIDELGVLIGPEGGWSDKEQALFKDNDLLHLGLHDFTLRAETAAIVAVQKLVQ